MKTAEKCLKYKDYFYFNSTFVIQYRINYNPRNIIIL